MMEKHARNLNRHTAMAALLAVAVLIESSHAVHAAPGVACPNPGLDCHRILVVPVKYVAPHCPDPTKPCPNYLSIFHDPPRLTAVQLSDFLDQRVNPNFDNWSFGSWQFDFDVLVNPNSPDGWWPMPANFQEYFVALSSGANYWDKGAAQRAIVQDAIEGIASQASISGLIPSLATYSRLLVIDNQHDRYGQSHDVNYTVPVAYQGLSVPHIFTASLCGIDKNDAALESIVSHELMHQLGPVDFYGNECLIEETPLGPFVSECNGAWDVMAYDSVGPNHPTAYNKLSLGWLPSDAQRVLTLPVPYFPYGNSLDLDPIEELDPSQLRLVQIPLTQPLTGTPFEGYHLECRKRINGDGLIPEEGVLIQFVREASPGVAQVHQMPARVIRADYPFDPVGQAALQVGESWVDPIEGITIAFNGYSGSQPNASCQLSVHYTKTSAKSDPAFKSGGAFGDLWIDSALNGLGIYPPNQPLDADGVPSGYGDPFWVGGKNALRFRVRNLGNAPTPSLAVHLIAEQPPYATCGSGSPPRILDEIAFLGPVPPGSTATGLVDLNIPEQKSMRVHATIFPVPGEAITSNNQVDRVLNPGSYSSVVTSNGPSEVNFNMTMVNGCLGELLFSALPIVLPVFPEPHPDPVFGRWRSPATGLIRLAPGESAPLRLSFLPPDRVTPGAGVTIPISIYAGSGLGSQGGIYGEGGSEIDSWTVSIPVVEPSALTADVVVGPHPVLATLAVNGTLTPSSSETTLGLRFVSPSRQEFLRPLTTDSRGSFSYAFGAVEEGSWTVQAIWQGDDARAEARSPVASFLVVPDRSCSLDAECDDGNLCTQEACDRLIGKCQFTMRPDGTACDDGDLCTTGGTCAAGACGQPVVCDDLSACTTDACDQSTGICRYDALLLDEVTSVDLQSNGSVVWTPTTGASHWNTYRGTIPPGLMGSRRVTWDEACLERGDAQVDGILTTTDNSVPPPGSAWYYVVTEQSLCGEGAAGTTPAGAPRLPPNPC